MSVYHLPKPCPKCGSDMELEYQENIQQGYNGSAWFWVCPNQDYYEQDENDYEPDEN